MRLVLFLSAMLLTISLTGCFGGGEIDDDDDGDGGDGGDGDGGNGTLDVTAHDINVTIDSHPENATMGSEVEITWSVDTGASVQGDVSSENNTTGANTTAGEEQVTLSETGLAWGFTSVAVPQNVTDYEEHEATETDAQAPGSWSSAITVGSNDTGNATGGNETGGGANGTGNGTGNQTLYVRAYATDENGTMYWSGEVQIVVESEAPGTEHTVNIAGFGPTAMFNPDEITIQAGDSVVWMNGDAIDLMHTATSTEGPEEFDTGQIAAGETSAPIVLTTPGTYTYECTNHPTMQEATIIVEGGNETS